MVNCAVLRTFSRDRKLLIFLIATEVMYDDNPNRGFLSIYGLRGERGRIHDKNWVESDKNASH